MSLLDFSKNCDIITSSFVDDLINYSLKEDGSLQWSDNTNLDYTVKNSINLFANNGNNYWTPNFVTNDNLVDNKIISHYGPVKGNSQFASGRIGIEDFISFTPRFKNWNVSNGNNMVIDWILNRSRTPHRIVAGLNYWKISSIPVTGSIEIFPPYSKIKHNNIEYIKLDNNNLRRLTVRQNVFRTLNAINNSSPINFNYTGNDSDTLVSSLGNNVSFTLVGSDTVKIWIPDGDQLLYFTNNEEESGSFRDRLDNSGTRSYVSGSLYKYYNMFYNSLTANERLVSINSSRSIKKLRRYKKLAHSLATSPFSSEFFFSFLAKPSNTIRNSINIYLNSNSNDINTDITNLTTVLNSISNEYSAYEINNNTNIVKNNNELFIKLINKYGAKLKLSNNSSVNYRQPLTHGDSILIEEIGDTLVPKATSNRLVTNNKKINLTNIVLETNLGEAVSSILLKKNTTSGGIQTSEVSNTVHLYDRAKPELAANNSINIFLLSNNGNESPENPDDLNRLRINDVTANIFYWKALGSSSIQSVSPIADTMDSWLLNYPKLGVLVLDNIIPKYKDFVAPNEIRDFLNSQFFCTWTKVSGPPMRFVDLNKTQTNKKYDIAYGHEVAIIPTSTGFYVIKCVVSSPWGTYTKFKTIVVVDGRPQIYGTNINANGNRVLIPNPNVNTIGSDNLLNMYHIDNVLPDRILIDPNTIENQYANENIPIEIQTDNLQVAISNLDSFAIHRNGLYSPIRTNYFVERISSADRSIEKLDTNYSFMFDKDNSGSIVPNTENCNLRIDYICNQTIIKLDRIILRNIRNQTPECSQCYSLYKPKFKSFTSRNRRPSFQRSNRSPDSFSLQKYLFDRPDVFSRSSVEEYSFPNISSDIAPPIKTYGGYGNKVLNKLTINNISFHDRPTGQTNNQIIASNPVVIPSVTGYKLDYIDQYTSDSDNIKKYVACYQNSVAPNGFIPFSGGAFVPNSGWVVGDSRNLSSVLKFNPGARKSFSFSGPGILNLSNYTNSGSINSSIFTSSIELTINPNIRWYDPPIGEEPGATEAAKIAIRRASLTTHNWQNQIDKELSDQLTNYTNGYHHGYRILNGGNPKLPERNLSSNSSPTNDEFDFSINEINNKFIYGFNVVGPNKPINSFSNQDIQYINSSPFGASLPVSTPTPPNEPQFDEGNYIDNSSGWNLRNPRINNLTIKDIEVKLNFLNYVNTKNLVIWLEVDFIGKYASREKLAISINAGARISPLLPFAPAQVTSSNIFVDQFIPNNTYKAFTNIQNRFSLSSEIPVNNTNIKDYLKELTDGNSVDNIGEKLILNLLNQEIVQNKEYNFTVTFSDSANKHNTFFDQNMFSSGTIDPDQNIIHNNMKINASRHSINYNTYDNSNFSNINKNNNLNINNNTFHKFANKRLFSGKDPEEDNRNPKVPLNGGQYDASTIFTLCIAVLEEEDEMFPMDNTISNEIYTNLASVENKISSANLFNNLCSWELILHTDDVKKPVTSQVNSLANYGGTDALSVIEYGEDPKYPGYGFIADLSDSKFLLPLVNMNSPTNYYQNYNACEYADNELIGKGSLINSPRFPTEAITLILAGTAVGGMSGTLVGALVGGLGATYYLGFELLFAYYRASRTIPLLELSQRETFDIDYEGYPFGNSDKILLNISKDGVFWYKVEASIFKLSNTPALSLKEYVMIKNDSKLFKFNFSIVSNNSDIIDDIFVPYIVALATPAPSQTPPTEEDLDTTNSYQDINNSVYNNFNFMSVDELVFANKLINSDTNIFQYINTPNETSIIIDHSMPYYLISIGDYIKLDCEYTFATVRSKALIYKDSRYQTVLAINIPRSDLLDSGCSSFLLPEDVVVICGSKNSTVENDLSSPVSLFGLVNNQPPYDSIPDLNFSTNSLGSYGDGSSIKDKNILSRKVQINTIDPIYSQLNSFNNDKHYYNELTLTLPSGNHYPIMAPTTSPGSVPSGVPIKIKTQLACYPVYYDNSTNNVINNSFYHIHNNTFNNPNAQDNTQSLRDLLDNINTSIKNNNTYYKDQPYNMMYIKGNNSVIRSLYRNVVSVITIENNYSYYESIHRITPEQLNTLKTRLDILNVTENTSLDPLIGVSSRTVSILNSNSISYIKQHYDILESNDNNKAVTYNKLQKLYSERNEIIKLLQHQTTYKAKIFRTRADFEAKPPVFIEGLILYDSLTYIQLFDGDKLDKENLYKIEYSYILNPIAQKYHTDNGGIIPDFRAVITTDNSGAISINYEKMSDNYYWINIDPKQSTSIAEESRPKILKSIKYVCQSVNPAFGSVGAGAQVLDFNNICPDWRDIDGKNGTINNKDIKIKADSTGTSYIFYNHDYNLSELDDPNTGVERRSYILESRAKLNAAKNLLIPPPREANYPETWFVNSWQEQIISRRFRINSDNSIVGLAPNQEFLVTTIETYEIALSPIEAHIKSIRGNNVNIVQSLLTADLIKNDYSGDILKNGLLNGLDSNPDPRFDGSRNTLPNRVYNIYNLDNITELKVQFRKVPRTLRGIDAIGSVLRYGETMSYKPQNRPPLDPLDIFGVGRVESLINNFYEWKCIELNQNRTGLEEATTPDFFKLLNEMVFRSFFGSVDEIENKTPRLKSLYDFEMIPYEYFTRPQPPPTNS